MVMGRSGAGRGRAKVALARGGYNRALVPLGDFGNVSFEFLVSGFESETKRLLLATA